MLVLGIDPGLTRCGVGAVAGVPGRPLALLHVEVVTTAAGTPLPERLLYISTRLRELIASAQPDVVAVERMFSQHNLHTVMGTAQASAAAVLAAAQAGLPVAWHTPTEVKAAVTGSGAADKAQVAQMVTRLLGLPSPPRPVDATDALALAICHVWRGPAQARLAAAAAAAPAGRIPRSSSASRRATSDLRSAPATTAIGSTPIPTAPRERP
jgi:crossover junction endodeoxyribonuclease RuvC